MNGESNASEMPRYRPGDTVTMDVEISHRSSMNIAKVEVRFKPEGAGGDPRRNLVLTSHGLPHQAGEQPADGGRRWSVARVEGEVSGSHAPGVYDFLSLVVTTAGGLRILLQDDEMTMGMFDRSLEVVRGTDKPKILRGRLIRQGAGGA